MGSLAVFCAHAVTPRNMSVYVAPPSAVQGAGKLGLERTQVAAAGPIEIQQPGGPVSLGTVGVQLLGYRLLTCHSPSAQTFHRPAGLLRATFRGIGW